MAVTLADAFLRAEALLAEAPDQPVLLRVAGLAFDLRLDGVQELYRSAIPLRTAQPVTADFEYFPFAPAALRSFIGHRAWAGQAAGTLADPYFNTMFAGRFRLTRHAPEQAPARFYFETLHQGFDHLAVPLEGEAAQQRSRQDRAARAGGPVASMRVAFALVGLQRGP